MGGFYGSVLIRSEDRDRILTALDALAERLKFNCLVSPVTSGWIGVYPDNGGQSDRISKAIAAEVGGIAWHVLVHDDSVLAYWLWRDGELIDSYWSCPGYFSEEDRAAQESLTGNPELLAATVGGESEKLQELLDRNNSAVFEVERLEKLGKLVGIKNLVTSYEYLKDGETEGITGAKKFTELPRTARKKKTAEKRDRLKALKKQGSLLYREEVGQDDCLQICASQEGLLVFRSRRFRDHPVRVSRCRSTTKTVEELPWSITGGVGTAISDESGRHVAIYLRGQGKYRIQIRDAVSGQIEHEIPPEISDSRVCASRDLNVLATFYENHLNVWNVRDGKVLLTEKLNDESAIAIHPSGEWIVTASRGLRFRRIELTSNWQDLPISVHIVRPDYGPTRAAYLAEFEATFDVVKKDIPKGMPEGMPEITAELLGGNTHLSCVGFSRDGNWLWCGGRNGVWVFRWCDIVEKGQAAHAIWWHPTTPWLDLQNATNEVRSIAEAADGQSIYFGTHKGDILQLDLASGAVRQILHLAEEQVERLVTSIDGAAIGCITTGLENGTKFFMIVQIWALEALARPTP